MGYTVIIGTGEDLCCELVAQQLAQKGREAIFLAENQLLPGLRFALTLSDEDALGTLRFAGKQARFTDLDGVLARHLGGVVTYEEYKTRDGQYISAEWHALMQGWLQSLSCPVINRPRPELWYKTHLTIPDLFSQVPRLGFSMPRTMVTTRVEDARVFLRGCSGRIRYSPLTQPARYLIDSEADLDKLAALSGVVPFYLVEAVAGEDLSACVVGDAVVMLTAEGAPRQRLPYAVERQCLNAAADLGLAFCSFSLVKTDTGDWYCLGVNALPQLYGAAEAVQNEITDHLVHRLIANGKA